MAPYFSRGEDRSAKLLLLRANFGVWCERQDMHINLLDLSADLPIIVAFLAMAEKMIEEVGSGALISIVAAEVIRYKAKN